MARSTTDDLPQWYLEGFLDLDGGVWRTSVHPFPFGVGRRPGSQVRLESELVSGNHAELFVREDELWVRDLGSTNGTFVDGRRIESEEKLRSGSLVQFADQEFRVLRFNRVTGFRTTRSIGEADLTPGLLSKLQELADTIRRGEMEVHLQPIVRLEDESVEGFEVLGRGRLAGRTVSPVELLMLAEGGGLVEELSALFRAEGVAVARKLPGSQALFVNTHPAEIRNPDQLLRSIEQLFDPGASHPLVLELHEVAVQEISVLKEVAEAVRGLGVDIAFDDFGTGQDRLVALAEVHPRIVKFDVRLIRGLHDGGPRRRAMVGRLVELVDELGIEALAEGVEVAEEAAACRDLGFRLAQGYLFGRPAPAESWG